MGRRRGRKRRGLGAMAAAGGGAINAIRGKRRSRNKSTKKAQTQVNKAAAAGMGIGANRKNPYAGLTSGGVPGQHTPSVGNKPFLGGLMPENKTSNKTNNLVASKTPTAGGKGAMNPSERFSKPQAGRGRGKGSRPIQESQQQMDGGGFRNRGYGMGREQRGYGMGKSSMPNFGGDRGFGMGRDQRGSGMGSQEMMQNRGYNSGMASSSRPSKGGMRPIQQPEGRPMDPSLGKSRATSPRASRSMSRGGSSFNPASGRMEYASQPNNFSRSSQRPTSRMFGGFRKNMGTTQGAFKLPNKSTIQK